MLLMRCAFIAVQIRIPMNTKSYSELISKRTYQERFQYLLLKGTIGNITFGADRYLNQLLYSSRRWRKIRNEVIIRDDGLDLGVEGYLIAGEIHIHHINPLRISDIENDSNEIYNLDNLITTSKDTHLAIHYGDSDFVANKMVTTRKPNDTKLW